MLAVLNKADLTGFRPETGRSPRRGPGARGLRRLVGVPVEPMTGLLAVAALDDLSGRLGRAARAGRPARHGRVGRLLRRISGRGGPVPPEDRLRLLDTLDLFGTALAVAAFRQGRDARPRCGPCCTG